MNERAGEKERQRQRERTKGNGVDFKIQIEKEETEQNSVKLTNRIYIAFLPLTHSLPLPLITRAQSIATLLIKLDRKSCVLVLVHGLYLD